MLNKEMFSSVMESLKKESPEFAGFLDIIDYANGPSYDIEELWQQEGRMDVQVLVNPGGSEGVYADWYFLCGDKARTRIRIGTLKTLDEGLMGYHVMGALAGMLTYGSWRFINKHYDEIREVK